MNRSAGVVNAVFRVIAPLAMALMLVLEPNHASAFRLFDSASFGTGVYGGTSVRPTSPSEAPGRTTAFRRSVDDLFEGNAQTLALARARADFQGFDVGAYATAQLPSNGPSVVQIAGGAVAYTGMTVSAETPILLRGSFKLEGLFGTAVGFDDANPDVIIEAFDTFSQAEVDLAIYDIEGRPLAQAYLAPPGGGTSQIEYCLDPTKFCSGSNVVIINPAPSGFVSGSIIVPFFVPLARDNGIIVDIFVKAADYTANNGASTFPRVVADFLHTASLTLEPPPGITVTLATGQVFGGSPPANLPPIANAGADRSADEGVGVTLDGSASSDPEDASLTYAWTQTAGPPVTLSLANSARPTFVAPAVPRGGATLTFQLVVNDGQQASAPAFVNVTVANVNHAPSADAGPDLVASESSTVVLDGSASFDTDGDSLTYVWTQTGGPSVMLTNASTAKPCFVAPSVGQAGVLLTFALTVSDGLAAASDSVSVFVENVNHPPAADAGDDQTRNEGATVALDGTASSDPDGDQLAYAWTQLSGPTVALSGSTSATPTFVAPPVAAGGATLVFRLSVSDGLGGTTSDEVSVLVQNVNDPPACHRARAYPPILWPPNHKLVPVTIVGHAWGPWHRMTTTVTSVTQDEPVSGLGEGDTSPDAVIHGSKVLLRAERSGTGNGRVYRLHFTATNERGDTCTGLAAVWVPKSLKAGLRDAIDDGQLYDSTQR
jgi:hypothetical protein